ncbi:MAG: MMPL family transporter [bacterium]|nr:MMPL family transporter [bacterium]
MATDSRLSPGQRSPGIKLAATIAKHSRMVIAALVVATVALSYPMLFLAPEETASQSPVTQITTTQELVAERFADEVFSYFLLVEANEGDMLARDALLTLLTNSQAMREDSSFGDRLVTVRDPSLGIDVHGIWSIADSVDRLLRDVGVTGGLADASQDQVDGVVAAILQQSPPTEWGLAAQATQDDEGAWHSPALFMNVAADNEKLGGGGFLVTIGTDSLEKEQFARDLKDAIAGDGSVLAAWAPASDVNLTSAEQGELAGPFVGLTIAAVLLIVGIAFRSYWAVAIAGAALAILMVWLRGGANLIGLKSDQILSTILPISMISFGIDSAFHGIGRVREEARRGRVGQRAFVVGLGSVFGALALAATSDAAAFLANTTAGIESVVQFGYAAALATVAAFLLLGVATPMVLSLTEGELGSRTITGWGRGMDMVLSLVAAGFATGTVLVLVFVSEALGLAMLLGYVVVMLGLPLLVAKRTSGIAFAAHRSGKGSRRLGEVVAGFATRPWLTIGAATLVTAVAFWGALHLEVTFDVNDFFSPDSDFVVGLDKTAEYLGDQGGEPAQVYVETDLASPEALDALRLFTVRVAAVDDSPLARDNDGVVRVDPGVLGLLEDVGVEGRSRLVDFYDEALVAGVSDSAGNPLWTPNDVGTVLWRSDDEARYATVLTYQIPDTRNQANVVRTRETLEPLAAELESSLARIDPDAMVVVTGSAVYRDDQLDGIRRSMLLALPLAVLACFVVAAAFMRSFRYALVSVVPILLVVTWLYGLMYQAGFAVNVVTSIIGAVSVGIGIDFSTHFTMRFLEERRSGSAPLVAVAAAGTGTGSALTGSAVTSVAGFGILAFAPMPMFATYGLLTAIMIVLALVASLFVLPSLLVVATGKHLEKLQPHRVVDLTSDTPIRIGMARDLSDGVVDHLLATYENELRDGSVVLRAVAGSAVADLIRSGDLDLGLMVQWPGADELDRSDMESLPLVKEDLVAVGGIVGSGEVIAPVDGLAHGLLVAGPHVESEVGLRTMVAAEAKSPVLAHTVADVVTGLRVAALTGGTMVLPRSMAEVGSSLPVRTLQPPQTIETILLASKTGSTEPDVFNLVVALSRALAADERMEIGTAADL